MIFLTLLSPDHKAIEFEDTPLTLVKSFSMTGPFSLKESIWSLFLGPSLFNVSNWLGVAVSINKSSFFKDLTPFLIAIIGPCVGTWVEVESSLGGARRFGRSIADVT